jgi:hypothetical protein
LTVYERKAITDSIDSLIQYLDLSSGNPVTVVNQYKTRKRGVKIPKKMDDNSTNERMLGAEKDEVYDVKTLQVLERLVVNEIIALEAIDRSEFPERASVD